MPLDSVRKHSHDPYRQHAAFQRIDVLALRFEFGFSLMMTIRVLQRLRHGMIGLRRALQQELNGYGQHGAKRITPRETVGPGDRKAQHADRKY